MTIVDPAKAADVGSSEAGAASPPAGLAYPGRGGLLLALLVLVNVFNFIDRQLPFILISAIKADLHLTDSQIALMAGLSFAVVFSLSALPLAHIADRWSPRRVLTISLSVWSAMTALSGLAGSFFHLLIARAGVAGSEAGCTPAAHALISRTCTAERRAMALAIFSLGVPIGSMLGLVLGGWINDLANWRVAFFIVGLPGLLLALVCWFVLPELGHGTARQAPTSGFWAAVRHLFGRPAFRHMAAGSALYACGSYAMNVFASAFLIRVHHLSTAQAGLGFGLAFGVGGLVGTFAGGWLSDHLGRRDVRWRQRIPAIGQLLSLPTALGAWLAPDPVLAVALLTLTYVFGLLYFAPSFATAQLLATGQMRATAAAVLSFCLTLVGSSVGPLAVGWASDAWAPRFGDESLRYAMCLMGITILWSAWHFHLAARALPKDLASTD
ncbi:MFS transporter [Phenylobacterium sp. LjRoot225]|uniref:spinster family MFS transporter n=1 Tax=Phenylobacterium sp. LjRoot225 TaxID=3342285 RepID=UPI003ECC5A13